LRSCLLFQILLCRRARPFGVALCLWAWVACSAPAFSQTEAVSEPGAASLVRLGILHPLPHLCAGQEPSERDGRVLRLAYGIFGAPGQRLVLPEFLRLQSPRIELDTGMLWPNPAAGDAPLVLARWLDQVHARIPMLTPTPDARSLTRTPGVVPVFRIGDSDPWLASRMAGSDILPFREESGIPIPCRGWPVGVSFQLARGSAAAGRVRYVLRREPAPTSPGFILTGYGSAQALWGDFSSGKLDVILADSEALQQEAPPARWAVQGGTQQVLLRWNPRMDSELSPESRRILSQAINRPGLAGAGGRGAFRAARAFLDPVLPEGRAPEEVLRWDSRLARKQWLAGADARLNRRLRFAVLPHPVLDAIARRLAGQWETTLGVVAVPERVEPDRLLQLWNAGTFDVMLDVVDLNDGSLQYLWAQSIKGAKGSSPPSASDVTKWEAQLVHELPYLPLLSNLQVFAARGEAGSATVAQLCPGCAISGEAPGDEN
jgi:hypothetical protein